MKILVAIECSNDKTLQDNALRWAARGGFALKVFPPRHNFNARKWRRIIKDVNYHWYLPLTEDIIESRLTPRKYAEVNGYDLLLSIPEDLETWRKGRRFKDDEVNVFAIAIGKARVEFGEKPHKLIKRWPNGAVMQRIYGQAE